MIKNAKSAATRHTPIGLVLLRSAAALLALAAFAAPAASRPFQQYLNGICGAAVCKINFIKVPAGQRLDVNNVSCYLRLGVVAGSTSSPQIHAAQLLLLGATPSTVVSAVTLAPFFIGQPGDEVVFAANHTISAFAQAQQRFQAFVEIRQSTFSQVACHISGDMVKV